MSQENVEIVRQAWEVFIEGMDKGNPAALFEQGFAAPEFALTPTHEMPGSRTYVGREGFIEFAELWTEDFLDWRIWPEEILDAGDRVVSLVRQSATGKRSGAPVELHFGVVHTLKGGQITNQRHFLDPAEALKAAGLRE